MSVDIENYEVKEFIAASTMKKEINYILIGI
jgi:hypothetical protein